METTLLLVDDHAMFRMGLRLLLERESDLRVVGEASDGQAAIEAAQELAPDVVVMDISMPSMDGLEATRRILAEAPETKVIVLSIDGDSRYVKDMLQAGAAGYLLKESVPEELVNGIWSVSQGEVFLSGAITDVVVGQYLDLLNESSPKEALESIKITKLLSSPGCSTRDFKTSITDTLCRVAPTATNACFCPGRLRKKHSGEPMAGELWLSQCMAFTG